jgi:hypothetical protein
MGCFLRVIGVHAAKTLPLTTILIRLWQSLQWIGSSSDTGCVGACKIFRHMQFNPGWATITMPFADKPAFY